MTRLLCLFMLTIFACGQPAEPAYLVMLETGGEDDCGYADPAGKIIVPPGKYAACLTDTLWHFAAVIKKEGGCAAIDKTGRSYLRYTGTTTARIIFPMVCFA